MCPRYILVEQLLEYKKNWVIVKKRDVMKRWSVGWGNQRNVRVCASASAFER
jgi:hypothetical protein